MRSSTTHVHVSILAVYESFEEKRKNKGWIEDSIFTECVNVEISYFQAHYFASNVIVKRREDLGRTYDDGIQRSYTFPGILSIF